MSKRFLSILFAGALCVGLTTGTAMADDHGKNKDKHKRIEARDRDDRIRRGDGDHDRDDGFDRRRGSILGQSNRPPGWSHGRKTGWGNCDVPPGQAKKEGCHNGVFTRRRRDRDDRISRRDLDNDRDDRILRRDRDHDRDDRFFRRDRDDRDHVLDRDDLSRRGRMWPSDKGQLPAPHPVFGRGRR